MENFFYYKKVKGIILLCRLFNSELKYKTDTGAKLKFRARFYFVHV